MRRVLPTPASELTAAIWPWPLRASSSSACSRSSSATRPMNRESCWVSAARSFERAGAPPTSSETSMVVSSPLIGRRPSQVTCTAPSASRKVLGAMMMVPGSAICSMRAARWVVWPTAV
jgi:hypothetical protein